MPAQRCPGPPHTRSYLLKVQLGRGRPRYLLCDLRTGECRRLAGDADLQRFLAALAHAPRLH